MKKSLKICVVLSACFLFVLSAMLIFYFAATKNAVLDENKLIKNRSLLQIFDKDLNPVFEKCEYAPLSSLPKYVPLAFVAVEDKRFFDHKGLDYRRIVKAALKNAASFSFQEGASTISQQLIKNTHLSSKKTLTRKLREMKLTKKLEKKYSKEQILEMYLNTIYFGHSAFGIESASKFYFAKSAKKLSPAEAALLAGLVKSPNRYSPFRDAEKCLKRRNFVLSLMTEEQNILSQSEYESEKNSPLPKEPHEEKQSPYEALVLEELQSILPEDTIKSGMKVYTYLNSALQSALEEGQSEECDKVAIVRSNAEGGIKAYFSTCGLIKRPPASTIKPLAVYGPAIEENLLSPATPILDEEICFHGYSPKNATGTYGGYMSARYALAHSVNIPAVKTLNALGLGKAEEYLKKLALPICKEDKALSLALGGMKEGFTLKSILDAYATFAREGYYSSSSCIRAVQDGEGNTLFDRRYCPSSSLGQEERVFSPETCALICDMLKSAVKEGTAKKLKSLPFDVYAKTGTAEAGGKNTDAYTVAFTYEDAVGVWLGKADNSPIEMTGGGAAANEAHRILKSLYHDSPPLPMPPCEGVVTVALDREEYENNHTLLLMDPTAPDYLALHELFKKSAVPVAASSKFRAPKIQKPRIVVKNAAVEIILCQTYYYDYEVKRECDGEIVTIYSGKYRKNIVDNSVEAGKKYTYTVTPICRGVRGESVTLPSVYVEKEDALPDDWWD